MALPAGAVFEVQTGGNDTNGGGFVTGSSGTDYSQNAAKNTAGADISTTDAVGNGTTTLTSATANFGTTIVGNIIYLQGGTGGLAAGRYQVTARASTTSITLDRAVAAGTGITMNVGGAVASLGILGSSTATIMVAGNKIWIKAGTYTIASATPNIATGCFSSSLASLAIEGYQTTRGDMGTPPLLQASGISNFTIVTLSGVTTVLIRNVNIDGASLTGSRGFDLTGTGIGYKLSGVNCTNTAFRGADAAVAYYFCVATGCSAQAAFLGASAYGCVSHTNTIAGFSHAGGYQARFDRCLSYGNSGATTDGFLVNSSYARLSNCVAYNNGRDGFRMDFSNQIYLNCIAEGHAAGWGFSHNGNDNGLFLQSCAGFNNNSGNVSLGTGSFNTSYGFVTGSASFFVAPGSGNFALNNTSGGGAAARAAGLPGVFPGGLTTGYLDLGAAQHQSLGGETASVF